MAEQTCFNQDHLVYSDGYAAAMTGTVLPFLKARETIVTLQGDENVKLYCCRYDADAPKGTVLLMHGFTENAYKFSEFIWSFLQNGFTVVSYDQRGHGRSERDEKVKADPSLVHVDDFEAYVKDMRIVCDRLLKDAPKPLLLFCHSMGGAVSALFMEDDPAFFSRAAMCAPMIAPAHASVPLWATKAICAAAELVGKGKKRIFISKPYIGPEDFAASCATGKERFDWYEGERGKEPLFTTNGATYRWLRESLNVTKKILRPGAVEKIQIPVRIWSGDRDDIVLPDPQIVFVNRLPHGSRKVVPGAKHEIYRSQDEILFPWWHEVLAFLKEASE